MSIQQQLQQAEHVVIQRLNALEQEIREIRKTIFVTHRLNALEQEIREIMKVVTQETKPFPEFPVIKQEQTEQQQQEFICTLCSVTKPIYQREREMENKNQVYANSVLIIVLWNVFYITFVTKVKTKQVDGKLI